MAPPQYGFPRWPWESRTHSSQAESAWNLVYKAPETVCICARGSSGVCLCRSPHSSIIPCPGEGRGEGCSVTPPWLHPLFGTLTV